ncbi:MAG: hypothetical protein ABEI78_02275 [Candidatus Nanohaloarchaea archaeon]
MAISTSPSVIMQQMMNFPHIFVIGAAFGYIAKIIMDKRGGGGAMAGM